MYELKYTLEGHKRHIYTINLYNDKCFSAGSEGKIRIWDLNDGTCIKVLNEKNINKTENKDISDNNSKNDKEKFKSKDKSKDKFKKDNKIDNDDEEDESY